MAGHLTRLAVAGAVYVTAPSVLATALSLPPTTLLSIAAVVGAAVVTLSAVPGLLALTPAAALTVPVPVGILPASLPDAALAWSPLVPSPPVLTAALALQSAAACGPVLVAEPSVPTALPGVAVALQILLPVSIAAVVPSSLLGLLPVGLVLVPSHW